MSVLYAIGRDLTNYKNSIKYAKIILKKRIQNKTDSNKTNPDSILQDVLKKLKYQMSF